MKIYEYESYEEYKKHQTEANKRKIQVVWVRSHVIRETKRFVDDPQIILCHGTRNGKEQKLFKENYPNAKVLGTEISDTASSFPDTIEHDFQEEIPEFVNACDIVYSNSFDHSINPKKCLTTWSNQLKEGGYLFLELMIGNENRSKASDPLEIEKGEVREIVKELDLVYVDSYSGVAFKSEVLVFKK